MSLKPKKYWIFTIAFWMIAALLMFLHGLPSDHWDRVIIRFLYFPILGLLITSAMTLIFQSETYRRLRNPIIAVTLMSVVAAVLTAAIINPVTYLKLNLDLANRHLEMLYTGTIFSGLFYLFWSFLYFQLDGRPLLGPATSASKDYVDRIGVEDRGQIRTIAVDDVECFAASGDYVEILLLDKSYLKKETISGIEALLNPRKFFRVHRSTIVNADKLSSISAKGSGTYDLTLASGRVISSSRSYRSVVMDLQSEKQP
jgi:hypothetical protein